MKKIMQLLLLSLLFIMTTFAQYTIRTSDLSVQNIHRSAPNEIIFSIYFKNTAVDSAINYSGGQFHIDFNKAILNGGTGTLAIINSGLPSNVQSTNPTVYITSTPGQLRLAPKAPPGALIGGYSVNPGDSVLVAKLSLSTSASSFSNWTTHSLSWRKAPNSNPLTKLSAYIWNNNQIISGNTAYFIYPTTSKELNITLLIEGFYEDTGSGYAMINDTLRVELRGASDPWSRVDSAIVFLNSSGNAFANFFSAAEATDYYIVVKHRNSIETWSKNTQQFVSGALSYNFTTANTQAFGNNLIEKPVGSNTWCIYSGDANQDGTIDALDRSETWNDRNLSGYIATDVNGDGQVDALDRSICWNNRNIGVSKPAPPPLMLKPIKQSEIKNDN